MKTAFYPSWRTPRELVHEMLLHRAAMEQPESLPVYVDQGVISIPEQVREYHRQRLHILRGLLLGGPDGDAWELGQ